MTTLERIAKLPYVEHVDDERNIDNGIIITLMPGFAFVADPDCGVRGFDTVTEAQRGTARVAVTKRRETPCSNAK